MRYPIRPMTYEALTDAARPSVPGQPEAYASTLYDTQTFTDNSSTTIRFFGAAQTTYNLGNLGQAAQLPAGSFFAIEYIRLEAITAAPISTAAGGVTGAIDDIARIFLTSRPFLSLTYNGKPYGPWPASHALAASGGLNAVGYGTFTAEESIQFAQADPQADGIYIGASILLMPVTEFYLDFTLSAVADVTADYRIRCSLVGTRYRPVV